MGERRRRTMGQRGAPPDLYASHPVGCTCASCLAEGSLLRAEWWNSLRKERAERVEPPKLCPTCRIELPVTGVCDSCS